jgi:hypothetical protein
MAHSDLPVPDFDQLPLTELRHRIRAMDERQLGTLPAHERAHGDRLPVLELLQTRLDQLADGARPSPGDPRQAPEVSGQSAGSPVQPATAAEGNTPLRHGVAGQTPSRGRP